MANTENAVSADGSRVIWTGEHLYMREMLKGETVELDAPTTGSGRESNGQIAGGLYETAAADGSSVFFLDSGELIKGQSGSEGADLMNARCAKKPGA